MREAGAPVYYRIYKELKRRIGKGVYSKRLPTEKELCNEFNVSRLTLRRALDELKRESVIESSKGRGTFVVDEKREESISSLTGFTEEAVRDKQRARSVVLSDGLVVPPEEIAKLFGIPEDAMVVLLERVRYLNDEPYGIERAYLNPLTDIRILNIVNRDMSEASLYDILKNELSLSLDHALENIEVCRLTKEEAKHLKVNENSYGIRRERQTFTDKSICVEVVRSVYRGDRYRLKVVRRVE
ncbi:MAG: GntR family transcriptional regulator [Kosmotogaceae bacterium]|nr:GntR family transcriptional regulator [Kosmotogaceae bacterium]